MLNFCERMLKEGTAFVDDTDGERMKEERMARQNSTNRDNSELLAPRAEMHPLQIDKKWCVSI